MIDGYPNKVGAKNVLAICAGVGGLELGLRLAHAHRGETIQGVCYVEREAAAAASLVASMDAGWFHPAPIWSDAQSFDGSSWRGCVDIVTSGDPCQGNSVAGKQLGELDDRWLLDRAIEIFAESGATTFFRENVPGNCDGQLAVAIPALERLGCRVACGIFSSAETGNTMRRERLFIVARRAQLACTKMQRPREKGCNLEGTEKWVAGRGGELGRPTLGRWDDVFNCFREESARQAGGSGSELAISTGSGRGRKNHTRQSSRILDQAGQQLPPAVIPGPTDNRGWINVLDRWPEFQPALSEEEAQSHLRRGVDAMAHRIERLRATGNGVDPVAAAYAYLSLDALLAVGARSGRNVLMQEAV